MIEKDPIVIRPTLTKDNSSRGNNFYGSGTMQWDPASCGYEAARGESARVILYAATRYADKGLSLSNNPGDSTSKNTMGTLKTLLEWNNKYAPSAFEQKVNERYQQLGFARNPFVDYPDFANYIWDENGYRTSAYQSTINPDDYTSASSEWSSYSSEEQSSEETSNSSTGGAKVSFELTGADFPSGSYDNPAETYTIKGIQWSLYMASTFDQGNTIQLKNGQGYFTNLDALDCDSLVITISKGDVLVYGGSSTNPSSIIAASSSGSSATYDISGYPYIKIQSKSGSVTNLSSVRFA
ncbi:MAG: endonuclease [Bacilli bacterium]|nr:endonuclease [Bacilli bacterium]